MVGEVHTWGLLCNVGLQDARCARLSLLTRLPGDQQFTRIRPPQRAQPIVVRGKKRLEVGFDQMTHPFFVLRRQPEALQRQVHGLFVGVRPDMQRVTDAQGVEWFEIPLSKDDAEAPVKAF